MAAVEENLPNLARHINCLNENNTMTRKKALQEISKDILARKTELEKSDLQKIFNELLKPLLKEFSDPAESCREQAIELMVEMLYLVAQPCDCLPYLVPVIVHRLGQQEIVEKSEEVRLLLVKLSIQIVQMSGKNIVVYLNDMVKILQRTILDTYPQIKRESCLMASLLSKAIPDSFHMQSESLINPLLQSITHQHSKVRVSVIEAIGDVIQNGNSKSVDDARSHLAQRLFDQVPAVRAAVNKVVGNWLLDLLDRYSFHHKLIPLLLTSISDEQPSIKESAVVFWHDIGLKFEKENESDFKDQLDFPSEDPTHFPPGVERYNFGCRMLVYRHLSKILPGLINDMTDWVPETRIQASSLLYTLLLNAERNTTQHLQLLLSGMFRACKDEEKQVILNVLKSAELIGYFVQVEIWSHLVLEHIDKTGDSASLMILAAIIKGCDPPEFQSHLVTICDTLISPDICYTVQVKVLVELVQCVKSIMTVAKGDCIVVSYQLFSLLVTVLSLTPTEETQLIKLCQETLLELANNQGLSVGKEKLYKQHGPQLLAKLKESHTQWTSQSLERKIFEMFLMEVEDSTMHCLADDITEILCECLAPKKIPELRLKMMTLLSCILVKHTSAAESPHPLSGSSLQIIQKMIVPNLVWKAGRTAAAIRTAAISAIWALLQSGGISKQNLLLVSSELLPQILSSMEDDNKNTRLISCRVLTRLIENMTACEQISYDCLHGIYPHLLKRLDDANDNIRVVVATTFQAYIDAFCDDYDTDLYKAHLETLYQGLLLHLDDSQTSIQEAILSVLKKAGCLSPTLLISEVEKVKHKHRTTIYCDQLLTQFT